MTKMKSKKMTKSTFAVIIMAIVMVAMMAFGGTYAYFTATARNEEIDNIKTAKLELYNNSTKLTYDSDKQIVPGNYIFGKGTHFGVVDTTKNEDLQQIDLSLKSPESDETPDGDAETGGKGTNTAVWAFVRVTTLVYEGTTFDPAKNSELVVIKGTSGDSAEDEAENNYAECASVLRLTVRTVGDDEEDNGTGWQVLKTSDSSRSTYIYIFRVEDSASARETFNDADFWFALQFDHRVQSSRVQDVDDKTGESKNTFTEVHNTTSKSGIMDLNVRFSMEFAVVQQLGWDQEAAKWNTEHPTDTRTPEQMAYFASFDTVNTSSTVRDPYTPIK